MNYYLKTFFTFLSAAFVASSAQASSFGNQPCDSQECKVMFEKFEKAAKYGSAEGQVILASMLYSGYGTQINFTDSFKWYRKAAKQSVPIAAYQLGQLYLRGEGTKQNTEKGIKWLVKSASYGVKEANLRLANIYMEGELVEQDWHEAERWLSRGDVQQDAISQFKLGLLYESNLLGEKNLDKAIEMYRRSANNNNQPALARLAWLSQISGNEQILEDLPTESEDIERITVTAPEISEMLAYSLQSINTTGVYTRRKTCSRIASQECREVKSITDPSDIAYLLSGRRH